jgi:hypothetical protein
MTMRLLLFLFTLSSFSLLGQVSYEFKYPLPPDAKQIQHVDRPYYGTYSSDSSDISYEFNENGVFSNTFMVQSISRETVRESSKYQIRNGYLHGVVKDDSVLVVEQDDQYYFGIPQSSCLICEGVQNVLMKRSGTSYILNFYENGHYLPALLSFEGSSFSIQFFDYELETKAFRKITVSGEKESENLTTITLEPDLKQYSKMKPEDMYGRKISYKRAK